MCRFWLILLTALFSISAVAAKQSSYRLTDFYPGTNPARLQGKSDSVELSIPLAHASKVDEAILHLRLVASMALIKERSIVTVRFNQAAIGQIALDGSQPEVFASVRIPNSLWRGGFNSLSFSASQHYDRQCTDGTAPELWSELDLYSSRLEVSHQTSVNNPVLADLSGFLAPGIGGVDAITLFSHSSALNDNINRQVLPVVSQALALRRQYAPLQVRHSQWQLPQAEQWNESWDEAQKEQYQHSAFYVGKDARQAPLHVVVGTKAQLSDILTAAESDAIDTAYLSLKAVPAFMVEEEVIVPAHLRLVVSGNDEQQVMAAAKTLLAMDDALNQDDAVKALEEGAHPQQNEVLAAQYLLADNTYSFADIGSSDIVFYSADDHRYDLNFRLPADFYVPESARAELSLDFGYGAGMGLGSVMNVMVNGKLIHGLTFDNAQGQSYRSYRLDIPARLLKGGSNSITFAVTIRSPLPGLQCGEVPSSHLLFQLANRSTLTLPEAGQVSLLPDLQLLAKTGHPYTAQGNTELNVYLTDSDMLDGALTFVGKLAQAAHVPLANVTVHQGLADYQAEAKNLVFGTPDSLPQDLFAQWNLSISKTQRWPYRLINDLRIKADVVRDEYQVIEIENQPSLKLGGYLEQVSSLGNMAVMTAMATEKGQSAIIAAQNAKILNARIDDITSLTLWGQLNGDFFAWEDSKAPLIAMQVAERKTLGNAEDLWLEIRLWLSSHPWAWLAALVAVILLLSLLLHLMLKRRNAKLEDEWKQ
ncbi:cellulose biosynthesis cyclic di-GMP-binding regulatory protein BcsB [Aliiglaciecola sp. CAU 1673]|uniref:cellulose biosynthesis cyclic di-GMP-binding regulatory protein BcsB n=1 Tax=Aliiglaciecola sp. CAU 1673 TaxID=3032595 RepID=UPI0023D9D0A7|nr:cellulose biosynthesis cyclic di-GMP-binding regulatory protein BcsB [Aliiglaciecola sp. CAU 1673]MDF2179653.1 cellulose biosynthesis cyclic di-GMP-binding regulatory protein BcsB [Aliiglaciecola sp. CAU 1673]